MFPINEKYRAGKLFARGQEIMVNYSRRLVRIDHALSVSAVSGTVGAPYWNLLQVDLLRPIVSLSYAS